MSNFTQRLKLNKMKAIIYARVSTQKQELERQIEELKQYAVSNEIEIVKIYSEKISGSIEQRQQLEQMISDIETKAVKVDKVLVWEFTRLGRSTISTLTNINRIKRTGVTIYVHKGGLNIDPLNSDPYATFLLTILTGVAELEKEQIVSRLQSGRKHAIENGVTFGRKTGTKKAIEETRNYIEISRLLRQGLRVSHISRMTKTARNTIYKIKESIKQ